MTARAPLVLLACLALTGCAGTLARESGAVVTGGASALDTPATKAEVDDVAHGAGAAAGAAATDAVIKRLGSPATATAVRSVVHAAGSQATDEAVHGRDALLGGRGPAEVRQLGASAAEGALGPKTEQRAGVLEDQFFGKLTGHEDALLKKLDAHEDALLGKLPAASKAEAAVVDAEAGKLRTWIAILGAGSAVLVAALVVVVHRLVRHGKRLRTLEARA